MNSYSSARPLKTTARTAFLGACGAGIGYGLKEALNYTFANYSLDIPPVITPTKESHLFLWVLGTAGAAIVVEKLYNNATTPFDNILPVADESIKRRTGKALDGGIKTITALAILTQAARQNPIDAALYTAFGLGVMTCIEPD